MEILSNGTTKYVLNLADQTPEESDVTPQEDTTDIAPFLFPAIGALLMLMFGGLLLSSGSMCKTKTVPENKFKRKFEQQYGRRIIRFHNVPKKIAQEPCPVLQQENNDIVDAVKKEYQDLPQYQPVSGLVSNIAGLHGETCAVNISRPSVIDRGVSPMHSPRNENTLDYENSSHKDGENVGLENDEKGRSKKLSITLHNKYSVGEDDYTQRIPTASSGIGTISPESFEIDSLEDFPISENDTQPLNETTTLQSNGSGFPVDKTRPTFERKIDRGVYGGGRLSVLQLECAPSCLCVNGFNCSIHGTKADKTEALSDGRRITNERLTWGDIAPNTNTGDPTLGSQGNIDNKCSDILRFCTPPADVSGPLTTKNIQERNQSPLRRADLEKWLNDVEEFRRKGKEPYNATLLESSDAETENHRKDYSLTRAKKSLISGHRKMRAPLQESLQLLKRLQLNSENDLQVARTKSPIHRGGRGSCLKTVRAPSSLCLCGGTCNAHCQVEVTSDQSFAPVADSFGNSIKHESTDTLRNERQCSSLRIDRIAKGGRQSTLNHVRAPSEICIHGPSCQFHCQKIQKAAQQNEKGETCARKYQELHPPEIHAELDELRGASSFGEVQGRYKTLQDQSYGHSTVQDNDFRKEECNDNNLRGASSFGDSRLAIPQQIVTSVENIRGASSFAQGPANDNETDFNEMRGASCFAPLDESIAGTTSVTLSFAVESDGESFLANTFSNKKGSVSTLNLRKCVDKLRDKTRVSKEKVKQDLQTDFLISTDFCKEKFVIDPNNNSSANHAREQINNHASDRRIERKKLDARGGITTTEKIDERKETSKGFGGRILKVGKDVTMMSTLLHALQRDGEQKQTETLNHRTTQRIAKKNISNCNKSLAGNLKFSVFYKGANSPKPLLYVSVLGLQEVSDKLITSLHSAYVRFRLFPKFTTWRRTKTLNISSKELVFKDHFIISGIKPADLEEAILQFDAVNVEEEERIIGHLEVPLADLQSRDKLKRTCPLQAPSAS